MTRRLTPLLPVELRKVAAEMAEELAASRLDVGLVPSERRDCARRGGKIRVALSHNPQWYRDLCAEFPKQSRKRRNHLPDTLITRRETLRALRRISRGVFRHSYDERVLPYVVAVLQGKYDEVPF